ncbi:MAG: helix-turn-helix domain-containing protein [Candidatus Peribacteraceae bacterium]|nr:helix-turn-helix domain-containing protein [Candidatus Peribacteraceae bacterium]
MTVPLRHYKELCILFASIETKEEANMLLKDILTPQEIESIAERWQLVQQLASGKTQRQISKDLNVSISKVTRGSRFLKYGTGGFKFFIEKLFSKPT